LYSFYNFKNDMLSAGSGPNASWRLSAISMLARMSLYRFGCDKLSDWPKIITKRDVVVVRKSCYYALIYYRDINVSRRKSKRYYYYNRSEWTWMLQSTRRKLERSAYYYKYYNDIMWKGNDDCTYIILQTVYLYIIII